MLYEVITMRFRNEKIGFGKAIPDGDRVFGGPETFLVEAGFEVDFREVDPCGRVSGFEPQHVADADQGGIDLPEFEFHVRLRIPEFAGIRRILHCRAVISYNFV